MIITCGRTCYEFGYSLWLLFLMWIGIGAAIADSGNLNIFQGVNHFFGRGERILGRE